MTSGKEEFLKFSSFQFQRLSFQCISIKNSIKKFQDINVYRPKIVITVFSSDDRTKSIARFLQQVNIGHFLINTDIILSYICIQGINHRILVALNYTETSR